MVQRIARITVFTDSSVTAKTTGPAGSGTQASRIVWNELTWRVDAIGKWEWGLVLTCCLMDPQPA